MTFPNWLLMLWLRDVLSKYYAGLSVKSRMWMTVCNSCGARDEKLPWGLKKNGNIPRLVYNEISSVQQMNNIHHINRGHKRINQFSANKYYLILSATSGRMMGISLNLHVKFNARWIRIVYRLLKGRPHCHLVFYQFSQSRYQRLMTGADITDITQRVIVAKDSLLHRHRPGRFLIQEKMDDTWELQEEAGYVLNQTNHPLLPHPIYSPSGYVSHTENWNFKYPLLMTFVLRALT